MGGRVKKSNNAWVTKNMYITIVFFFYVFFIWRGFSQSYFTFFIEGVLESKSHLRESFVGSNEEKTYLSKFYQRAILGPPGGHCAFCRRCGVACIVPFEGVPLLPLCRCF